MKRTLVLLTAAVVAAFSAIAADAPAAPKAGDKAPLIQGQDQEGHSWKLSDEIGKKVVLLYFYPKDDTKGCTAEACGFRDNIADLKKQNVEVIGVSFDSADSHKQFITKYSLNFPLLVDTDGKIADAYGARAIGKDGKPMARARRVSFLIGLDGKIQHVTDSGNPQVHLTEMKDAAEKLKKS
jgi:peroxiredoxin Q/BCP